MITSLLFSVITSYSQSKDIKGSWIYRDSVSTIQFFIKPNGVIEKRTAPAGENVWNKTPQAGTYTFNKEHSLVIKWADKSIENVEVKFIGRNAEFQFTNKKERPKRTCLFLRIVDEEILPAN
jgi:hypothetical protein